MRNYDYRFLETTPIPSDVVSFLVQIHEFKGKQSSFYSQQPDVLHKLVEVAKIQSTGADTGVQPDVGPGYGSLCARADSAADQRVNAAAHQKGRHGAVAAARGLDDLGV